MDNKSQLTLDAEKLLERMKLGPPREPGDRLRPGDALQILTLADSGVSQTEVARQVGCHQSTVSRTIAEYEDTRPLARKRLEGAALAMAEAVVTAGSPDLKFKALQKLDVVRDDRSPADMDVSVRVVLGVSANYVHQLPHYSTDAPLPDGTIDAVGVDTGALAAGSITGK